MPNPNTVQKARASARAGKSPSTQAGEFVHEEIHHIREGKHGAKNPKQAIAIGLSKARRAGVAVKPPRKGASSPATRRKAQRDTATGRASAKRRAPSSRRSKATTNALRRQGRSAASHRALSRQAKKSAASRRPRRAATRTGRGGVRRA